MILSKDLKWIGFDLDLSLVETFPPDYKLEGAKPILVNCKLARKLTKMGFKVVIFTARPSADYRDIERWLKKHRVPFRHIDTAKPLYHRYVDDKAVNPYCGECLEREGWND